MGAVGGFFGVGGSNCSKALQPRVWDLHDSQAFLRPWE